MSLVLPDSSLRVNTVRATGSLVVYRNVIIMMYYYYYYYYYEILQLLEAMQQHHFGCMLLKSLRLEITV